MLSDGGISQVRAVRADRGRRQQVAALGEHQLRSRTRDAKYQSHRYECRDRLARLARVRVLREEDKKTDLVIQVKPTIVKDNYSGIVKQYYHEDAEKRLIVADPSKMDSTLIDSTLIK